MKHPFPRWASTLVLAVTSMTTLETQAGVILISTRAPQDTAFGTEYVSDPKGPGMATPGDALMATVLNDHGYVTRLIIDKLLSPAAVGLGFPSVESYLLPADTNFAVSLFIASGSGASADTPPPPAGIPIMMGEHVTLGNNDGRPGSIFMYNGTSSSDPNESTVPEVSKYMKVLVPDHPIFQGIQLDAQNRVKIWREPYPHEEANVPTGGKRNYEFRWCTQAATDAAAGVTVLAVLDGIPAEEPQRSVLAVADVGAELANQTLATSRLVHMFINETGSGGSRRVFNALTEVGRLIFVRSARWAMGETLEPVQSFRVIDVSSVGLGRLKVSWDGSAKNNYQILAAATLSNPSWQTIVDDIPGADGVQSRTLDISQAPSALFMRVRAMP